MEEKVVSSFDVVSWIIEDKCKQNGNSVSPQKLSNLKEVCFAADNIAFSFSAESTEVWINTLKQIVIDIKMLGDLRDKCVKAKEIGVISKYAVCVADIKEPGYTTLSIICKDVFESSK